MSLATVLEAVDHEKESTQPDEWLDFLILARDALQERIEKEIARENARIAARMRALSEGVSDGIGGKNG
jgi:hypothetical protein